MIYQLARKERGKSFARFYPTRGQASLRREGGGGGASLGAWPPLLMNGPPSLCPGAAANKVGSARPSFYWVFSELQLDDGYGPISV